jgi:hypothetical protein
MWQNPYLPLTNQGQPVLPAIQAYQQQQSMNGIIQVNGPDSAMQCNLPPNSTSYPMFNTNGKVFYVVTTDGNGSKTIETFSFAPFVEEQTQQATDVVSRREFNGLAAKVEAMEAIIGGTNGTDGPVQASTAAAGQPAV